MVTYSHFETVPLPLEHSISSTRRTPASIMKRVFDIVVAGFVTVSILVWLIPILGLLIKFSSPGPMLFVQLRTGRRGQPFPCLKLRTMVHNRSSQFEQVSRNDSRVTRLGRFLRKSNLDEMPQFLNVLAGHMSIVGPRPHPIPLDAQYWTSLPGYQERYMVKPGITGLAQVRGARGETRELHKMRHRVRYDHWYIRRQSPWLDAKICWWTVRSTVQGNENAF